MDSQRGKSPHFLVCLKGFKLVKEVALQRPSVHVFALVKATRMLAWIPPDPAGLVRGVTVFIGREWRIVVVC